MTRRIIQIYRGTTAQNDAFTGAAGELTMDTTLNELRVHDGSTAGGHKIGAGYNPDLFTPQWSDHIIDDMNWARSDTFSWLPKSGNNGYPVAYDHLADDISGKSLTSETIAGTTIQFYLADDGHKICPASEESNVAAIYAATGVAWYYILDTTNQRFKLPRTKFGFTGLRDTVGKYVAPGLPNITGSIGYAESVGGVSGVFYKGGSSGGNFLRANSGSQQQTLFDASQSNSIYDNSTTVQPPATQMYLYFYVGNFTQTALENTAGLNASLFNDKVDLDLSNVNSTGKANVVEFATPDYASVITGSVSMSAWTQCAKTSFVCVYGGDPYTENYYVYVSPDGGTTTYVVGRRTDDVNSNTQTTSFTFIVPAGWYFNCGAEGGSTYYIYPLKGVAQ